MAGCDYDPDFKMNPPLRSAEDVKAVREGLADGTIDAIATDHAPHSPVEKELEFDAALNGVVGLETAFPVCLALVRQGAPHRAAARRGAHLRPGPRPSASRAARSRAGAPADVAILDPARRVGRCDPARFQSKSRNTPWKGRTAHRARARTTLVGGRLVHETRGETR